MYLYGFKTIRHIAGEFTLGWYDPEDGSDDIADDNPVLLELNASTVIAAVYEQEAYSGHAFVVYERDGKIYEATAYHCSCYGLEGQWKPEEATIPEIVARPDFMYDSPHNELIRSAIIHHLGWEA